jgi:hypothetical protein
MVLDISEWWIPKMLIDYNDLMEAVAAEDDPAVIKILSKMTPVQLNNLRIHIAHLAAVARVVQREQFN